MTLKRFPTRAAWAALLSLFCLACVTTPPSADETEAQASAQEESPEDGQKLQNCSFQIYDASNSGKAFVNPMPTK